MTVRQMLRWDPLHDVQSVARQLTGGNAGFVKNFSENYPESTNDARSLIMGYYPLDFLPALHRLARSFVICDNWFSSLPGPTWPNRFFALTGTANGRVDMPGTIAFNVSGFVAQTQETLFDRLNEKTIHWKIYFHDIPQTAVLVKQRDPHNAARYFYIDEFFSDAHGAEEEFPQFSFIEPDYMGFQQNDAHPPHDVMKSEKLIADVYNALRANERLWTSTLLIVTYDEHGGFYDHVIPPAATPPDGILCKECAFDRLGVRVPALLVSPLVSPRVIQTQFDHTSILKYLTRKWALGPLGKRTEVAECIGSAIDLAVPRTDTPERIELSATELRPPDPEAEDAAFGQLSLHQTALQRLGEFLKQEAVTQVPPIYSGIARLAMAVQAICARLLEIGLQERPLFPVSIAEPDKLANPSSVDARDSVARYIMRKKRYTVDSVANRLSDVSLTDEQVRHSVQTLALITGRNFHLEEDPATHAKAWLAKRIDSQTK